MAQYSFDKYENLVYGEEVCFRTSLPYYSEYEFNELVKSLIQNTYLNQPDKLSLQLDLYIPRKPKKEKMPLLVLAHDGAFQVGDKGDDFMSEISKELAKRGVIVASINYALGFQISRAKALEAIHKAALNMRGAIRYLLTSEFADLIDIESIYVGGASAGGITSLTAAFLEDGEFLEFIRDDLAGQAFFECMDCGANFLDANFSIKGVISLWGGIVDISWIDNKVSTLLIHGVDDEIVPYEYDYPFVQLGLQYKSSGKLVFDKMYGSKEIKKKLGSYAVLVPLIGYGHSPQYNEQGDLDVQLTKDIINLIDNFINKNK